MSLKKSKHPTRPARVIVLSGPSGAGKTTLHDILLASKRFKGRIIRSISATTRLPRGKERHGQEYLFLSKKMFEHKIRAGHFLEWAKVFDNFYGTPLKEVRENLAAGKSVLLCIDVQGARAVKKKIPEAVLIFVSPPSLKELEKRLLKRGTDTKEAVALRLKIAREELAQAKKYDHLIVNDRLDRAARELENVVEAKI